jgi:hypothetical protein
MVKDVIANVYGDCNELFNNHESLLIFRDKIYTQYNKVLYLPQDREI